LGMFSHPTVTGACRPITLLPTRVPFILLVPANPNFLDSRWPKAGRGGIRHWT